MSVRNTCMDCVTWVPSFCLDLDLQLVSRHGLNEELGMHPYQKVLVQNGHTDL